MIAASLCLNGAAGMGFDFCSVPEVLHAPMLISAPQIGPGRGSAGIIGGLHTHPTIRLLVSPSKAEEFVFTTVSVLYFSISRLSFKSIKQSAHGADAIIRRGEGAQRASEG